jgi:hypothetical protein
MLEHDKSQLNGIGFCAFRVWSRGRLSWLKFLPGFPKSVQINAGTRQKSVKWNRILCKPCALEYISACCICLKSKEWLCNRTLGFPRVCMNPSNDRCLIFPKLWGFSECCRKNLTGHCEETDTLADVRLKLTLACGLSCEEQLIYSHFSLLWGLVS